MSYRTSFRRLQDRENLLPRFGIDVAEYPIDSNPPLLPARNSRCRLLAIATVAVFCAFGFLSTVHVVTEPIVSYGSTLAHDIGSTVRGAIHRANEEAEKHANEHYTAQQEYLQRKGRYPAQVSERRLDAWENNVINKLPVVKSTHSALLLRMAVIRKVANELDDTAVEQYFPSWIERSGDGTWNQDAVLRDLVIAVSQLAHRASVDAKETNQVLLSEGHPT